MEASLEHQFAEGRLLIRPLGGWVIDEARGLEQGLRELFGARAPAEEAVQQLVIDLSGVEALDTAGAFLLARLERRIVEKGGQVDWRGADAARQALLERVREVVADDETPRRPPSTTLLQDVGETVISVIADARRLLLIL